MAQKFKVLSLVACGILRKEIEYLILKNNWNIKSQFLSSSLHTDFDKLYCTLNHSLEQTSGNNSVVFYGECHPLMDQIIDSHHTIRTPGQNCVEILLGHDTFTRELSKGAFFLLEDWVTHWDKNVFQGLGANKEVLKDIFHSEQRYFLTIRTPCSGDFSARAKAISTSIGLPLHWMDTGLDLLEANLKFIIGKKNMEASE